MRLKERANKTERVERIAQLTSETLRIILYIKINTQLLSSFVYF